MQQVVEFYAQSLKKITDEINNYSINGVFEIGSIQIFPIEIKSYNDPSYLQFKKLYDIKNSDYELPFRLYEGVVLFNIKALF